MGHSSVNISLTYLRGLEIAELKEEDMPMVYGKKLIINTYLVSPKNVLIDIINCIIIRIGYMYIRL